MVNNPFVQAYRQAPWRSQLQWAGVFLLILVLVAAIGSIYLNISASAAASGREIQRLNAASEEINRAIADDRTQLAALTSTAHMQKRAEDMDFKPVTPDASLYVVVPGYTGRTPASLAPAPHAGLTAAQPLIKNSYTQSLSDLLFDGFLIPFERPELREVKP